MPFAATEPLQWVHRHIARKPVPPINRLDTVPAPVSAIVMKLLARTAEERDQDRGRHRTRPAALSRRMDAGLLADFPLG